MSVAQYVETGILSFLDRSGFLANFYNNKLTSHFSIIIYIHVAFWFVSGMLLIAMTFALLFRRQRDLPISPDSLAPMDSRPCGQLLWLGCIRLISSLKLQRKLYVCDCHFPFRGDVSSIISLKGFTYNNNDKEIVPCSSL